MKKTITFMALLSLLNLAFIAIPGPATAKEANSIDELVAMFDDSKCAGCHEEIYKQWQNSWHSKAVISSLKGMRNFIAIGLAKEWQRPLTKTQVLKCLDCHAPAVNFASEKLAKEIGKLIVTSFDKKGKKAGKKAKAELARLNVGCLSCHNIKATSVARGLRGDPVKNAVYGPNGNDSDGHETMENIEMTRSAFCMQCHGKYFSADGEMIQCNTLSGSFQNTYVSLGGSETCQDCHMKKGHLFPGGHDLDTVKEGLGLDVQVTQYRHLPGKIPGVKDKKAWVPSAVVTAFVENRSGHRIPDG
jgi:nitrate/TMAO reductase-like tetraheme cytochrome c subunit